MPSTRDDIGYLIDGEAVTRTDGSVLVTIGDGLEVQPGSRVVDATAGDIISVEAFDVAGDIIMVTVSGCDGVDAIHAETLDNFLEHDVLDRL